MEIVWSHYALERVEEIGDFIAQDSPPRATSFIKRLITSVERLREFPFSGSVVPENTAFRQVVFEGYRLIYRVTDKHVQVITVISPGLLLK